LISLPLYSNAKDPDPGLPIEPRAVFQTPAFLHLLWQQVITNHPQALSQTELIRAAGSDLKIAEQSFYPTPSWVVERVESQVATDRAYAGSSQVSTLRVQQPLWTGGRLTAQLSKAVISEQIETERLQEVNQSLALKTLQAWLEVVSAQRQQKVLQEALQVQTGLLQTITQRAALGYSAESEVKLSQWRIAQAKHDMSLAALQEQLAWLRLKQWVPEVAVLLQNWKKDASPRALGQGHVLPLPQLDWENLCLMQSPTLQRMASVLAYQRAEVKEKRALLQPEVYVRLERQQGNFIYANTAGVNRLFVGMTASTGAGLSLQHQLATLDLKQESTKQETEATERAMLESLQSELLNINARQSKVETLHANLKSAQDIQGAWQRQFEAGRKSWIDVVNAVKETSQAELAFIDNDIALQLSYWRLQVMAFGVMHWKPA
jgi:adhesin transport system outer membrane protein